jgi:hypothetical protein
MLLHPSYTFLQHVEVCHQSDTAAVFVKEELCPHRADERGHNHNILLFNSESEVPPVPLDWMVVGVVVESQFIKYRSMVVYQTSDL